MLQQMQQTEDLQQFVGEFAKHNRLADIIQLAARMCSAQNAGVFAGAIADKVGPDTDKGLIVLAISLLYQYNQQEPIRRLTAALEKQVESQQDPLLMFADGSRDVFNFTMDLLQRVNGFAYEQSGSFEIVFRYVIQLLEAVPPEGEDIIVQAVEEMVAFIANDDVDCRPELKVVVARQLADFIGSRRQINFNVVNQLVDYLQRLDDQCFGQEEGQSVEKVEAGLYATLKLLSVCGEAAIIDSIPYIVWVLTDPLMFNESRDVQLLAELLRRPLSREFKPLAQRFIKNASIRVSQCETVLIHNPLVFVQQCLACGVTEEVEELVQRVLFTMSQVDDEVLQHSIVQLVFRLLDDSRDEVQLSQEDARKLAGYLVDNQLATDPVGKICRLVPFFGYASYGQIAERLLAERELTVEQMRRLIETCFENSVGEECIRLVQRIFELATEKQLQRYALEDQYDMLKVLFDGCMDYVPELLPSYVLILYKSREKTQLEPADLLVRFSLEQQAGTAAVLLGYAFDIRSVNEYLAEPLESYVPMQVLDAVMSADAGVLDYVVRACYYMLKQWSRLCDSQDELAKKASTKGVTSLCHHESIGQYLLKVLL